MEGYADWSPPPRHHILVAVTDTPAAASLGQLCDGFAAFADVRALCTPASMHYFDRMAVAQRYMLYIDADDTRVADVPVHAQLLDWADTLVIAPLSAQKLAEIANGFAVDLLTRVVRSWDFEDIENNQMFLAPDMGELMWRNDFTTHQINTLQDHGARLIHPLGNGKMRSPNYVVGFVKRELGE